MGTKYSASGTLQLTQKIFDPSVWIGLKAAKLNADLSLQTFNKPMSKLFTMLVNVL